MLMLGDSTQVLKGFRDNSFDLILCDPPYGISFMGKDWDKALPSQQAWKECFRVLKEGKLAFIMCSPRQDVLARMIINLEDAGFKTGYTSIYWTYASGFPKAANISKLIDKRNGTKGEIISKGKSHVSGEGKDNSWNSGYKLDYNITKPATDEAKKMEGAYVGFQPKPAVEIILVVSKGKTLTWLDDCRIPYQSDDDYDSCNSFGKKGLYYYRKNNEQQGYDKLKKIPHEPPESNQKGRFPANLLVSDDILNVFEKDYSRYFSLDQWWRKFIITPKASKSERNEGCEDLPPREIYPQNNSIERKEMNSTASIKTFNHHPTVKPIKLMSYLITLGSREGDIVLDPFVGSGTTYKACLQLHRKCVGIEINPEYLEIAEARIKPLIQQRRLT